MTTLEYNHSVDMHADKLFRFIIKNIRNYELAEDIVQESYMRLWENVAEIEWPKAKSWLFSTAYRYMIDIIRKNKVHTNWEEVSNLSISHSDQYSDLGEVLDKALKILPTIQRTVVMLRDYEGYSYEEIGQITDLKASQVKVYIFRARKALKDYLVSIDILIE